MIERRTIIDRAAIERFEAKFIPEPNSGCWLWTAATTHFGYGAFRLDRSRKQFNSHRVAWLIYRGPIPEGKWVLHHCDNPPCVNPDHLFLGDNTANIADRVRKNRSIRGNQVIGAKLSEASVRAIRVDDRTQQKIADDYGVSRSLVGVIKQQKRWRHVS